MNMDRTGAIQEAHVMDVDDEEVLKVVTATLVNTRQLAFIPILTRP